MRIKIRNVSVFNANGKRPALIKTNTRDSPGRIPGLWGYVRNFKEAGDERD